MSLYWKIAVWTNLVWLIIGVLFSVVNGTFTWLHFIYGLIGIGTIIKCLELAKDNEIKNKKIKELRNKVTLN